MMLVKGLYPVDDCLRIILLNRLLAMLLLTMSKQQIINYLTI